MQKPPTNQPSQESQRYDVAFKRRIAESVSAYKEAGVIVSEQAPRRTELHASQKELRRLEALRSHFMALDSQRQSPATFIRGSYSTLSSRLRHLLTFKVPVASLIRSMIF